MFLRSSHVTLQCFHEAHVKPINLLGNSACFSPIFKYCEINLKFLLELLNLLNFSSFHVAIRSIDVQHENVDSIQKCRRGGGRGAAVPFSWAEIRYFREIFLIDPVKF